MFYLGDHILDIFHISSGHVYLKISGGEPLAFFFTFQRRRFGSGTTNDLLPCELFFHVFDVPQLDDGLKDVNHFC